MRRAACSMRSSTSGGDSSTTRVVEPSTRTPARLRAATLPRTLGTQRARRARIELPPGRGPLLVVPRGTSDRQVRRLLDEWRPWVERRLARRAPAPELAPMTEREGRARAREAIERIAATETGRLGVSYRRIRIADQRTRWGSCSPGDTLSFSWRLALAPPPLL